MTEPAAPTPTSVEHTIQPGPTSPAPIVARAGSYYRSRRYIMVIAVLAGAAYFAYDGWKGWPEHNARVADVTKRLNETRDEAAKAKLDTELRELGAAKSDFDILLQKVLALSLPVLAIAYLVYFLRKSRGEIVLNGDVLSAPGHPPVSIDEIRSIDHRQWKKKGIAYLSYESGGRERVITLDDFVYDQTPVDDIYAIIAARHGIDTAEPAKDATPPASSPGA